MGVEKDTVSLGSTHKQPKFLITGIGLKLDKNCFCARKNAKRTSGSMSTQPQYWGSRKQKCWRREIAEAHKCWTFDIFEVHEAQNAGFLGRGRFSKHKNAGNSGGS